MVHPGRFPGGRGRGCREGTGAEGTGAGGGRGGGAAMSSPGGAFPLHALVWNNDHRRLDQELHGQVRGAGGAGAATGNREGAGSCGERLRGGPGPAPGPGVPGSGPVRRENASELGQRQGPRLPSCSSPCAVH